MAAQKSLKLPPAPPLYQREATAPQRPRTTPHGSKLPALAVALHAELEHCTREAGRQIAISDRPSKQPRIAADCPKKGNAFWDLVGSRRFYYFKTINTD